MSCKALNRNCEELLLDYAAGTLDQAHTLIVATYLTLSPAARRYVADCETLGGALMEHICDPVAVSEACLEQLLEKISCMNDPCAEEKACCNQSCIPCGEILPAPIANALPPGMARTLVWKKAFDGMIWIDVPVSACSSRAQLMRCAPGFIFPHHTHPGLEITLVLEGAFSDEQGHYSRGDLLVMDGENTGHRPVADAKTGCLCLSVTTQPARFSGFLARLRNRMTQF